MGFDRVEARVDRDPVQPRTKGGPALEPGPVPPRLGEGVLHEVLGLVEVADHPVAVHSQLATERFDRRGSLVLGF